jgi:hypothetical protein
VDAFTNIVTMRITRKLASLDFFRKIPTYDVFCVDCLTAVPYLNFDLAGDGRELAASI